MDWLGAKWERELGKVTQHKLLQNVYLNKPLPGFRMVLLSAWLASLGCRDPTAFSSRIYKVILSPREKLVRGYQETCF